MTDQTTEDKSRVVVGGTLQSLPCKMTEAERLEMAMLASQAYAKVTALTEEAKGVAAGFKERIAANSADVTRLMRCIETSTEWRDVELQYINDFGVGRYVTIRTDTGEEYDSRPLTAKEKQGRLFGDDELSNNRFQGLGSDGETDGE